MGWGQGQGNRGASIVMRKAYSSRCQSWNGGRDSAARVSNRKHSREKGADLRTPALPLHLHRATACRAGLASHTQLPPNLVRMYSSVESGVPPEQEESARLKAGMFGQSKSFDVGRTRRSLELHSCQGVVALSRGQRPPGVSQAQPEVSALCIAEPSQKLRIMMAVKARSNSHVK